jgi:hypothetical protein
VKTYGSKIYLKLCKEYTNYKVIDEPGYSTLASELTHLPKDKLSILLQSHPDANEPNLIQQISDFLKLHAVNKAESNENTPRTESESTEGGFTSSEDEQEPTKLFNVNY